MACVMVGVTDAVGSSPRPWRVCPALLLIVVSALGCAHTKAASSAPASRNRASPTGPTRAPLETLERAEAALEAEEGQRALDAFTQYLTDAPTTAPTQQQRRAYLGLAAAHELLRDCPAAIRAYDIALERYLDGESRVFALARRGACQAELEQWEDSASSFAEIAGLPGQLPSVRIEALARQGYALFSKEDYARAQTVLERADAIFAEATRDQTERFASQYFVGMARFYRAAIVHVRFRDVQIELPPEVMKARFEQRMELLLEAQDAYNHASKAKHVFWVSASGYQLGHLLGEFYDELADAPVPEWLDDEQRSIYYDELDAQLEPVLEKAIWVFEKNLETARRLGYDSPFIAQSEARLGQLQEALGSDQARGAKRARRPLPVPGPEGAARSRGGDPASFVPTPTPL